MCLSSEREVHQEDAASLRAGRIQRVGLGAAISSAAARKGLARRTEAVHDPSAVRAPRSKARRIAATVSRSTRSARLVSALRSSGAP
jgi:hypothetical protein